MTPEQLKDHFDTLETLFTKQIEANDPVAEQAFISAILARINSIWLDGQITALKEVTEKP